jgi:hypothetical protein
MTTPTLFGGAMNVVAIDQSVNNLTCEQCGKPFEPRSSGGKQQRFCTPECRTIFKNHQRITNGSEKPNGSPTDQPKSEPLGTSQAPKQNEDDDFDWSSDANDNVIVIREQPETAIYFNRYGALVMRQKSADWSEDDQIVFIKRPNMAGFIDRLIRLRDGGRV